MSIARRSGSGVQLARISLDDHKATTFGVFRAMDRGDYGSLVSPQLAEASTKRGPGDLAALLRSNGTWDVTN